MIGNDNLSNKTELRRSYGFETVYDNNKQKLYSTRLNVDVRTTDKTTAFVKIRKESQGNNRLNANNDGKDENATGWDDTDMYAGLKYDGSIREFQFEP